MASASGSLLNFIPERPQGLYTENPIAKAEDNRTRYLFIPFLPFRHAKIDLSTGDFYVQHIPEGRIVMIKEHQYYDPCLTAGECDSLAAAIGATKKGEIGVPRKKSVLAQVNALLKSYRRKGLVQITSPLELRQQQLPDGWDVEFAVSVILDGVLNPPDETRSKMDYQDMAEWYRSAAITRLQETSESPSIPSPRWYQTHSDKDLVPLPPILLDAGLAILEEIQGSLKTALTASTNKIDKALDEMQSAKTPKGGRSKLSSLERRTFKWAGQPTPLERDMLFEQNKETGLIEKLGGLISNFRQPAAPVVEVVPEQEIQRRAAEMVQNMMPDIVAQVQAAMNAQKAATEASKVEDTPRGAGGKFTKKEGQ